MGGYGDFACLHLIIDTMMAQEWTESQTMHLLSLLQVLIRGILIFPKYLELIKSDKLYSQSQSHRFSTVFLNRNHYNTIT